MSYELKLKHNVESPASKRLSIQSSNDNNIFKMAAMQTMLDLVFIQI